MGRRMKKTLYTICATIVTAAAITAAAPTAAAAPITEPTATQTATGGGDAYCDANFLVVASWPGGRAANLTVRNTSAVSVRWERIALTFPGGPVWNVQALNSTVTREGPVWTIVPSPDRGLLPPGYSTIAALFLTSSYMAPPPQYKVACTPV